MSTDQNAGDETRLDQNQVPSLSKETNPILETPRRHARPSTIIWGLVIMVLGVGVLFSAFGFTIDFGLIVIGLLAGAGVALLITSLMRSRH